MPSAQTPSAAASPVATAQSPAQPVAPVAARRLTPTELLMQQMAPQTRAAEHVVRPAVGARAGGVIPAPARTPANTQLSPAAPAAVPTIARSGGESTQELWNSLRGAVRAHRNSFVEMAYHAHRLDLQNDWAALGIADAEDAREMLGLPAKKWRDCLILGERLAELTLEEMRGITIEIAEILARIPDQLWDEYSWVEEARHVAPRDFKRVAAERLRLLASPGQHVIPRASLQVKVPVARLEQIEARLDSLRRREKLTSPGDALEFALLAAESGPALAAEIYRLDQVSAELARTWVDETAWDAQTAAQQISYVQKLAKQVQRSVREMKKNVAKSSQAALESEVSGSREVSRSDSPRG